MSEVRRSLKVRIVFPLLAILAAFVVVFAAFSFALDMGVGLEARQSLDSFLSSLKFATFGLLLCGAGSVWLLTLYYQRTVLNPLSQLSRGFRAVSGGDLSATLELPESRDELRQMCADFNAMTVSLRESNNDLRAFVSVAAHDLRSPLATIRSFCDLLHDELKDGNIEEAKDHLDRVSGISDRALELMDQLLKFEQVGRAPLEQKRLKLFMPVSEAIENLGSLIHTSQAKIEVGPLPSVMGDATQLRALFQNLLGNAIKFRRPDVPPQIKIEGKKIREADQLWHEVHVTDNGRGFDDELAAEIFKPFSRLKNGADTDGFGVGLSTCRKIMLRHDGEIRCQAKAGEGADFIVRFPVVEAR